MFTLSNNNIITVNRGDEFSFIVFINAGNEVRPIRYKLFQHDELYLGIMEARAPFEKGIVRKKFTQKDCNEDGDVVIKFEEKDTVNLLPGEYFLEIKLKKFKPGESGEDKYEVNTVIPRTKFIILE